MATNTETMQSVIKAYIKCALWSSSDESDDNGGAAKDANYSINDIAPEALETMARHVTLFCNANIDLLAEYMRFFPAEYIGCDFWLSRNKHGAGFFDRYCDNKTCPESLCEALQEKAGEWGECSLYVGDDGKIYVA